MNATKPTDLRDYLRIINRRRVPLALTSLVVLAATLVYSFVKTPIYSATATVLVPQQQAVSALNIQNQQLPAAQSLERSLADEQQFASGDAVKEAADQKLGYKAKVSVGSSSTADVLTFKSRSTDKSAAALIANTYASMYIDQRRANQVAQYTQQVTALERSISQLRDSADAAPAGSAERAALQQSIAELTQTVDQTQAAGVLASQLGATVATRAQIPNSAESPKPLKNGALGAVLGLLLGVGVAFLVERLDDGINSMAIAERSSGNRPVLGLIPLVESWKPKGSHHVALKEEPNSTVAETYRTLRTSIQFLSVDRPRRILAVTSALPGEGKTTTVANLAVGFARAGQKVVVVSCDLRRPRIHEFFSLSNDRGLSSVIIGSERMSDILLPVPDEPYLRVLPSGPVPPNPAELLSQERVREVVRLLAEDADVILLDCPPVIPVTDTLLLSRLADGVLTVAAANSTSRRDLSRAFEMLTQVQAPVLGTVLNRVPAGRGSAYRYGYHYYGSSYSTGADVASEPPSTAVPLEEGSMQSHLPDRQPSSSAATTHPVDRPQSIPSRTPTSSDAPLQ